jgi:hypothetical protein
LQSDKANLEGADEKSDQQEEEEEALEALKDEVVDSGKTSLPLFLMSPLLSQEQGLKALMEKKYRKSASIMEEQEAKVDKVNGQKALETSSAGHGKKSSLPLLQHLKGFKTLTNGRHKMSMDDGMFVQSKFWSPKRALMGQNCMRSHGDDNNNAAVVSNGGKEAKTESSLHAEVGRKLSYLEDHN